MEIGNAVRQVVPVIAGTITDTRYNKSAKSLEHLVEFDDAEGQPQQRWFLDSELEIAE